MKIAIILICILFLAGCSQVIWCDPNDVCIKVNTFFKDIEFDRLAYGELMLEKYTGESKNIKAITPYGVVETED